MELPLGPSLQLILDSYKKGRRPSPASVSSDAYSVMDLRKGHQVRLEGLVHADLDSKAREIAVSLEGSLAYVKREANERGEVKVTPRVLGWELVLSGHFLKKIDHQYMSSSCPWSVGDAVRAHVDGRVVKISKEKVWVQSDVDAEVFEISASSLASICEEERPLAAAKRCMRNTLVPYQWQATDEFMSSGKCLGIFPMGAGKTVMGLTCACRALGGLAEERLAGRCVLVLTPRRVVPMWEVELKKQLREDLRANVHLVTYESLGGALRRHGVGEGSAFRWRAEHTPQAVAFLYMDEFHEHRNAGARSEDVRELVKRVQHAVGVTATPFSTDPEQVANQCSILGLGCASEEVDLESVEFWIKPDAFNLAAQYRGIVWVDDVEVKRDSEGKFAKVPKAFPDHEVLYAPSGFAQHSSFSVTSHLDAVMAEHFGLLLGVDAKQLHEDKEQYLRFCTEALRRPFQSKITRLLDVLSELFEGGINGTRHRKIVVAFHHPSTGWLLHELLKGRVRAYMYCKNAPADQLDHFLNDASHRVVLLLSTITGGTGLNIVNKELSPTAVVRFEMADSQLTDGQLLGRCVRPGQIYPVQPVRLVGPGTVNGWRWGQIVRHTERVTQSGVLLKRHREAPLQKMKRLREASEAVRSAPESA